MADKRGNTRTIAINTLYLYIRMFITMSISLYTSRLVLSTLGVEDYGLYNVVGGVITMFSFLNATMAGATSRFITYEYGKGGDTVQRVFSTSLTIHIIISIIVLLIGETFCLWFLNNKLVISTDRLHAANYLLQYSIVTMLFNFTQVPYNACIIANERMKVYALIGLIDSLAKLIIVYLISICNWDKLIFYGFLIMIEQVGVTLYYRFYCINTFNNCKFSLSLDKRYFKPMLSYSIWDVFGQGSIVLRSQGINILLNLYFGTLINAAASIATQVQTNVLLFSHNVMTAFRPQVVKNYAQHNLERMEYLIIFGAKTTFLLFLIVSVPLIIEMDLVLHLWLKDVPRYTVDFTRLALLSSLFGNFSAYPMMGIDATAKIRDTSIIIGTIYIVVIVVSYICFYNGFLFPQIPYIYNAIIPIFIIIVNIYFLHKYVGFNSYNYLYKAVLPCLLVFLIDTAILYICHTLMCENIMRLLFLFVIGLLVVFSVGINICYEKEQRNMIKVFVLKKLNRNEYT